jgi:predicted Zn-dependent protease with MMP-like domain
MSDEEFEKLVAAGLDAIPEEYAKHIENVAIVFADEPSMEQRRMLNLRPYSLLFGLYEGVPKTKRNYSSITLPDKITIFKFPIIQAVGLDHARIKDQVARTVLHEIEHHFGFGDPEIRSFESKR